MPKNAQVEASGSFSSITVRKLVEQTKTSEDANLGLWELMDQMLIESCIRYIKRCGHLINGYTQTSGHNTENDDMMVKQPRSQMI